MWVLINPICDGDHARHSALWNLMRTLQESDPILTTHELNRDESGLYVWRLKEAKTLSRKHLRNIQNQHMNILLIKEFWQNFRFLCPHPFFCKLHSAVESSAQYWSLTNSQSELRSRSSCSRSQRSHHSTENIYTRSWKSGQSEGFHPLIQIKYRTTSIKN